VSHFGVAPCFFFQFVLVTLLTANTPLRIASCPVVLRYPCWDGHLGSKGTLMERFDACMPLVEAARTVGLFALSVALLMVVLGE